MTNRDMLIKLVTQFESMQSDVAEIKVYTAKINGGLRKAQNDVTAIQTNCGNFAEQITDFRKRINVFSTIATVGGGILGYLGSYLK